MRLGPSDALYRRRWCELVIEHFAEKPELVKRAEESLDAEVKAVAGFFGNTIHKSAQVLHPDGTLQHVNFEAMMSSVDAPVPSRIRRQAVTGS